MRVSRLGDREEDDPRFISVKQQRERIEWWASGNDVTVRWYEETDVSGGDATRPEWNACIEACERGELRGVVVYNLSRWARRARDAQDAFDRLQAVGARFVSVQESFDDSTMMGRFARDIVLLIAQLDRERAIETWDAATRQAVEDGVHVAPTPYGYTRPKDAKGKTERVPLQIDPERAPLVRQAFEARAGGASWRQVAQILGMSVSGSHAVLCNEAYMGWAKGPKGLVNKTAHPAIIDANLWQRAQVRGKAPVRNGKMKSMGILIGTVRCAGCGARMHATPAGSYQCRGYRKAGVCPAPAGIAMHKLDRYVREQIDAVTLDPNHPQHAHVGSLLEGSDAYDHALAEVEEAQRRLDQWLATDIDLVGRPQWEAQLKARQSALDEARDRRDDLASGHEYAFPEQVVSLEQWEVIEARRHMARLFTAVNIMKGDPRRGRWQPVAERVEFVWR